MVIYKNNTYFEIAGKPLMDTNGIAKYRGLDSRVNRIYWWRPIPIFLLTLLYHVGRLDLKLKK